jgi:hypothetical protein
MIRSYAYLLPALALIGWILFQILIRRKKISEIVNEVLFIIFFIAVWLGIYYWALD